MRKIFIALVIIVAILGCAAGGLFWWYRSGGLQEVIIEELSQRLATSTVDTNLLQEILGSSRAQTYLLLFLNNTELRPAGGFIGAYAVVRIDKGVPQILKVEGTEILDNFAPQDFPSFPPEPLQKYLYLKRWGFRDSNWSPDFGDSAIAAMYLFKKEQGVASQEIDAVIGFTPTVIEEILKISGPLVVDGEKYDADGFTQKLEYEVEYGYRERGLEFNARKKVLADLTHALVSRIKTDVFKHWPQYFSLAQKMLAEKQITAYSIHPQAEEVLLNKGWAGEMKQSAGDYVLWVDANLASLKTDKAIERELSYSFTATSSGKFVAALKMRYKHNGVFDKFTTRYRTYARAYLPLGSKFISAQGSLKNDRTTEPGTVDQGVENGRQWFGTFIAIEPGKTGELIWKFYLAPQITADIKNNKYGLLAQKQIGTIANKLTLDLNFGKNIEVTSPAEAQANRGDGVYTYQTDLRLDREFDMKLEP